MSEDLKLVQLFVSDEERDLFNDIAATLNLSKREVFRTFLSSLYTLPMIDGLIQGKHVLDAGTDTVTIQQGKANITIPIFLVYFDVLGNVYEVNTATGVPRLWGTANLSLRTLIDGKLEYVDFNLLRSKLAAYYVKYIITDDDGIETNVVKESVDA